MTKAEMKEAEKRASWCFKILLEGPPGKTFEDYARFRKELAKGAKRAKGRKPKVAK